MVYKMSSKAAFIGNCQMEAITKIIGSSFNFGKLYTIEYTNIIHKITKDEMLHFINNILTTLKLLIYHPITDNYRINDGCRDGISIFSLNNIRKFLPKTCKLVVVPNAYFTGYFPKMFYLKTSDGENVSKYGIDYHDKNILEFYYLENNNNDNVNRLVNNYYDINYYNQIESLSNIEQSIINLEKREKFCDIIISDYIAKEYRNVKLFNTINHPTTHLMKIIVNRLLKHLAVEVDISFNEEVLNTTIFPIDRSTYHNCSMNFINNDEYYIKGKYYSISECVKMYLNYYEKCIKPDTILFNVNRL